MKAVIRLNYDGKNIVSCFNDADIDKVYKFVDEIDRKQGIAEVRNIEFFVSDDSELEKFAIRQKLFFSMVEIALSKFKEFLYIDDVLFHDKNIIFTTTDDKLYWVIGESYSYIYSKEHVDYMSNDAILYFLKLDADIYVINVNDATIDKISDSIRETRIKELKKEVEKSLI